MRYEEDKGKDKDDWKEVYSTMIEDCLKRSHRITDWEETFLNSIEEQIRAGKILSKKQTDVLDSIWEKATEKG